MKVRATRLGYYNNKRVREGQIFEMAPHAYYKLDKDGKPLKDKEGNEIVCSWVELLDNEPKAKLKGKAKQAVVADDDINDYADDDVI